MLSIGSRGAREAVVAGEDKDECYSIEDYGYPK